MHKRFRNIYIPVLLLTALVLGTGAAIAQEELTRLRPESLIPLTRSAALFEHDMHNEKAGLGDEDCVVCHHSSNNGVQDMTESSEGTPCGECHAVAGKSESSLPLRNAYHRKCMTCHQTRGAGPTYCAGCHAKKHM